ncbi:MAG: ribonuclease P protein component [Sediminibacterium sp.]
MGKAFSYHKKEKLKSRKQLDRLFTSGRSFSVFPIKVFYMPMQEPADHAVKAGVGVSTRNFKKAVQRNRIKRLLRESYRLEKKILHDFMAGRQQQVAVFFLYIDKVLPDLALLQRKMPLILHRLIKELNETFSENT